MVTRCLIVPLALLSLDGASGLSSDYLRPVSSPMLSLMYWPPNLQCRNATLYKSSCSDQVHLALGGEAEMVVVFASQTAQTPSTVSWWREGSSTLGNAVGSASAYSQLIFLNQMLTSPSLGLPSASNAELLAILNTSAWAFDPFNGNRAANYLNPTQITWGLGAYFNPQVMIISLARGAGKQCQPSLCSGCTP